MNPNTEQNYLKSIFKLCQKHDKGAFTNDIAFALNIQPASVSEALKKLSDRGLIHYQKYKAVTLTENGNKVALKVIRNHRLWEVFLVEKLGFSWEEIHPMAEEMEHINFDLLIDRLDNFLGNPQIDPHGDPIPNKFGEMIVSKSFSLSSYKVGEKVKMVGIDNDSESFLKHLNNLGLLLGCTILIKEIIDFDQSMYVQINESKRFYVSKEIANNVLCR